MRSSERHAGGFSVAPNFRRKRCRVAFPGFGGENHRRVWESKGSEYRVWILDKKMGFIAKAALFLGLGFVALTNGQRGKQLLFNISSGCSDCFALPLGGWKSFYPLGIIRQWLLAPLEGLPNDNQVLFTKWSIKHERCSCHFGILNCH